MYKGFMRSTRASILAVLVLGTAALAGIAARAQTDGTTAPRYSEWQGGDSGKELQDFVAKLKSLVDQADKAKAADPLFIQDLRNLIASASAPAAQPTARLLYDNFRDGNFTTNPAWTARAGPWGAGWRGSARRWGAEPAAGPRGPPPPPPRGPAATPSRPSRPPKNPAPPVTTTCVMTPPSRARPSPSRAWPSSSAPAHKVGG